MSLQRRRDCFEAGLNVGQGITVVCLPKSESKQTLECL
jgi:hypothetical protein